MIVQTFKSHSHKQKSEKQQAKKQQAKKLSKVSTQSNKNWKAISSLHSENKSAEKELKVIKKQKADQIAKEQVTEKIAQEIMKDAKSEDKNTTTPALKAHKLEKMLKSTDHKDVTQWKPPVEKS